MTTNCNCEQAGMVVPASNFNKATSCKEKPKGLTTVQIPASRGSSAPGQPLAPVMGAYQNTLVHYLKDGALYLYDENGVYTNLTGDSVLPIIEELQTQMEQLSTTVQATQTALATETANRITNQQELQATLTALQQALATETTNRELGETANADAISALKVEVSTNTTNLEAETVARTSADETLQSNLTDGLSSKQDTLISGTTIKTVNGQSLLGPGNIDVEGGGGSDIQVVQVTGDSTEAVMSQNAVTQALNAAAGITAATLSSENNQITLDTAGSTSSQSSVELKTVNGETLLGEGDITSTLQLRSEVTQSGGQIETHTGNLHVETRQFSVTWAEATIGRQPISFHFGTAFAYPPAVFMSIEIPLDILNQLTAIPDFRYGLTQVTTATAGCYYTLTGKPSTITDPATVNISLVAIGITL